ncbi:5-(carboxyamino)imidazole ribonucleotide mutase [Deferribacterales bacterium RsTz2092]|nr:N5-carboxyaminoimidazole ribonucleotide mutase [Deferribacterales bacterium]
MGILGKHTVGIIMGSKSDLEIATEAIKLLHDFGVQADVIISSAHRTPKKTSEWASTAKDKGHSAIIAFAGAAAHLAGVVAAETNVPVIAVPIAATSLAGLDALLSMVQMPGGIPVAVMAIGKAGAKNAALFACQLIATNDIALYEELVKYRRKMAADIEEANKALTL